MSLYGSMLCRAMEVTFNRTLFLILLLSRFPAVEGNQLKRERGEVARFGD